MTTQEALLEIKAGHVQRICELRVFASMYIVSLGFMFCQDQNSQQRSTWCHSYSDKVVILMSRAHVVYIVNIYVTMCAPMDVLA